MSNCPYALKNDTITSLVSVSFNTVQIIYTGWFIMIDLKYLLSAWSITDYVSQNRQQNFTQVWTFWYLAFKIPKKTYFVKIEVCEEIVRFSHIGEYTKENFIYFRSQFLAIYRSESCKSPDFLQNYGYILRKNLWN